MNKSYSDETEVSTTEETQIVILSPDSSLTPEIIAKKVISLPIIVKTTCWGLILSGDPKIIENAIQEIRKLDHHRIFVKKRGYPPGDPRICRFHRGGGPRPGFHFLEFESSLQPLIGKALDSPPLKIIPSHEKLPEKKPLSIKKLKKIIAESKE